jgi:hypothetical protein
MKSMSSGREVCYFNPSFLPFAKISTVSLRRRCRVSSFLAVVNHPIDKEDVE